MYRIMFAPDGEYWIDNKANDRRDAAEAIREATEFRNLVPCSKVNGSKIFER